MKQLAAVLGVGQTHYVAKRHDVTMSGLCREAIDEAMADAGIGPEQLHVRELLTRLQDETVQKVIGGVVAGIAALIGIKAYNGRKRKSELKELQKLLANR